MKYAHSFLVFRYVYGYIICSWTSMRYVYHIRFRVVALVLEQPCDCPNAYDAILKDMGTIDRYNTVTDQLRALILERVVNVSFVYCVLRAIMWFTASLNH